MHPYIQTGSFGTQFIGEFPQGMGAHRADICLRFSRHFKIKMPVIPYLACFPALRFISLAGKANCQANP